MHCPAVLAEIVAHVYSLIRHLPVNDREESALELIDKQLRRGRCDEATAREAIRVFVNA